MVDALPGGIVARVQALGRELVALAQQLRDAPLAEQETAVLATVRAALPDLLLAVVQASTSALDAGVAGVRRRCPQCDRRVRVQSWRPRQVHTVCGPITLCRPWYVCQPCGHGFSPVDATLALPPRARLSVGLEAWLVRLGAATTFRDAVALLQDLTGLTAASETVRQHCLTVGQALETRQQAAIAQVVATQEPAEAVDPAPGTLVVEADGVLIRYRDGWHEVKVGVVGGSSATDGLTAASYVAAREEANQFGPRLLAEAARRGALEVVRWDGPLAGRSLAVLRPVHVVGDGAPWIWNLAGEHFGERTEVVDFYHAAEHLWEVARALEGAETAAVAAWAGAQIHDLYEHGGGPVRTALATAQAPTPEAAEVLRVERGYFASNAARMDYPAIRDQGLPIGSGAVEATGKYVVQHRMKRPGQRWSEHGGRAMLALRACVASGRTPLALARCLH
jgi:hypothetical protein